MSVKKKHKVPDGTSVSREQVPWSIVYYLTADGSAPALEFLDGCPRAIDAQFTAVLDAVAAAPPPRFSGGGLWEAMHASSSGSSACWKAGLRKSWRGADFAARQ
jgi:hypothetical protein